MVAKDLMKLAPLHVGKHIHVTVDDISDVWGNFMVLSFNVF